MTDEKNIKVPESYERRLNNYLRWATMDSVGAGSTRSICAGESSDGLSPQTVMYRFETKGERGNLCSDAKLLYRYAAGKSLRDFYVSNWVKDVEEGLFVAEEFICTGGMDIEEFHAVFKRYPDPWLMRRIYKGDVKEALTHIQKAIREIQADLDRIELDKL